MHDHHIQQDNGSDMVFLSVLPFIVAILCYILAAILTNRHYKTWPLSRIIYWTLGIIAITTAVIGPLAALSHTNFIAHMTGHLLLGMLGPLLIALAAPMTLLFRSLNVRAARLISSLLKSGPVRFFTDPFVATVLNIGGLWLLYTTGLYTIMHQNSLVFVLVHIHIFLAGYLYTISLIYIDPISHRTSFIYRATMLILSLAAHGILSKYLYANPPEGVPALQAETGSMLMFYGGDIIDAVLIIIFCYQWFKISKPKNETVLS